MILIPSDLDLALRFLSRDSLAAQVDGVFNKSILASFEICFAIITSWRPGLRPDHQITCRGRSFAFNAYQ